MFSKSEERTGVESDKPPPGPVPPLTRPAKPAGTTNEASVINSGLKVIGNMESDGDIVISGTVEGDITSRGLTVSEGATVKGTVTVGAVSVLGRVEGEIRTRAIRIAATGEIAGNIKYETMAIEEGAQVDGHVVKVKPGAERGKAPAAAAVGVVEARKPAGKPAAAQARP